MQKLKIAAVSAESGGELDLKSPEEDDLRDDMYKWEKKKELGTAACRTTGIAIPRQGSTAGKTIAAPRGFGADSCCSWATESKHNSGLECDPLSKYFKLWIKLNWNR